MNFFKSKIGFLKKSLKIRYLKYIACCLFFIVWLAFFDRNSWFVQRDLSRTINELKEEKSSLKDQISETRLELVQLRENKERFAREKYFMHAPNEEVFVIKSENKQ